MAESQVEEKKVTIVRPQKGFQERFMASDADITIGGGAAGVGKASPYTEPTLTPNGWVPMGDIKKGSEIICPITGDPKSVLKTFHHKELNIYKVTFNDGTSTECCDDHLWRVQTKKQISNGNYQTIPLSRILEMGIKNTRGDNRFAVDCNAPIKFESKDVGLDPYLLGLILGDGHVPNTRRSVSMAVHSDEGVSLFKYLPKHLPSDVKISMYKVVRSNCIQINFSSEIKKYISPLGLDGKKSGNKFVPKSYLYNSIEIRKEVLAGLLDTDSYIEVVNGVKKKTAYFTTSQQLKDDICELIRSLGGIASVSTDGRDKYKSGVCYKIAYRLPFNPFKRDRRKVLFDQVGYKFHFKKKIISVDYVGKKDGQCIMVDSDDHMYITNGYNATHNTAVLALDPLYDISNPEALSVFFRRKATELGPVLKECRKWYTKVSPTPSFTGKANSSEWKFTSGFTVEFAHLQYDKDVENHQGKEYSSIYFDELTHFTFYQFNYLLTRNRSTSGAKSRVKATCNPDPDSWVARLIDWWIGEDGLPIPERWGKVRYFLVNGDTIAEYIWGDSPEDVKEKAGDILKKAVAEADSEFVTEDHFINSLTFIGGKLNENKELLKKDPTYYSRLYNQGSAVRKRLLEGNWKFRHKGDEMVGIDSIASIFDRIQNRNASRRAITADVAGKGSDNMVIMVWEGFHLVDINVIARSDGKEIVDALKAMQRRWNVDNGSVVFDANGVGSHIDGFIPGSVEYKSQDTSQVKGTNYKNMKAMCCMNWADRINGVLPDNNETQGINYSVASRLSGIMLGNKTLQEHLTDERKAIRLAPKSVDGKYEIIKKSEMITILGHSPDFVESMLMLECLYLSFIEEDLDFIW